MRVEPVPGAEPLGIDAAVALAREQLPDTALRLVFLPARPDQPIRVALSAPATIGHGPAVTVLVDPWARRVVEVFDPRGFSPGETMLAWQHALHAGQGFGPVWKMLVFLSGLLPLLFTVTGILMWRLRRRRRRRLPAAGSIPLLIQCTRRGGPANERDFNKLLWVFVLAVFIASFPAAAEDPPYNTVRSLQPKARLRLPLPPHRRPAAPGGPAPAVGTPRASSGGINTAPGNLPRDLSAWNMFRSADHIVKGVIIGLSLASVLTWTVALAKFVELWLLQAQTARRRWRGWRGRGR